MSKKTFADECLGKWSKVQMLPETRDVIIELARRLKRAIEMLRLCDCAEAMQTVADELEAMPDEKA